MVVEDGTGLKNADSYVSVVYADDYLSARGHSEWIDLSLTEKETALIKATDFIDSSFRWLGKKAFQEQSLKFPRVNLFDEDGFIVKGVPNAVMQSVCEVALISSNGEELFQTEESNGAVTSEKIGSIAFTYDVTKRVKGQTLYDSVNLRLKGLYSDQSKQTVYSMDVKRV